MIMITNIILIILSIIMGLTMFAGLIAAALDEKGKICAKLILSSFILLVIIQIIAHIWLLIVLLD